MANRISDIEKLLGDADSKIIIAKAKFAKDGNTEGHLALNQASHQILHARQSLDALKRNIGAFVK